MVASVSPPPQTAREFCRNLLLRGDLASKLRPPRNADGKLVPVLPASASEATEPLADLSIDTPTREPTLRSQQGAERLPKLGALREPQARIECLRRFAHHELQAIELFAWAVLRIPTLPPALARGFLLLIEEEQQHLSLYLDRLAAHGAGLNDAALSDYLWQHRSGIEASAEPALAFLCALGLTFEQANLDFALLYRDAFRAAGDEETARVLQRVHDDEIRHVRLAVRWLRKLKRPGESDLAAYLRTVPFPLSAARAKGRRFDTAARRQAGFDDEFIAHVAAAKPYEKVAPVSEAEAKRLWLLPNLGAEEEQAVPVAARGFFRGLYGAWAALFQTRTTTPWLLPPGENAATAAWRAALFMPKDSAAALACLDELTQPGMLCAWLNTAAAAQTAAEHRLTLLGPAAPIVASVHDKAFAQELAVKLEIVPGCLRGLVQIFTKEECQNRAAANERLLAAVAGWPEWTGRRFVIKPRFGTSGRGCFFGQLSEGALVPPLSEDGWSGYAARGGCVIEPWLDRLNDLSIQLMVRKEAAADDAAVEVLGFTTQIVTQRGRVLGNRGILDSDGKIRSSSSPEAAAVEDALARAARKLGGAAAARGFFGIAGIDAFRFRGPDGQAVLRPIVELNARFTTGTVALGLVRRATAQAAVLRPQAWALLIKAPPKERLEMEKNIRVICPLPRGPALLLADDAAALDALCTAP